MGGRVWFQNEIEMLNEAIQAFETKTSAFDYVAEMTGRKRKAVQNMFYNYFNGEKVVYQPEPRGYGKKKEKQEKPKQLELPPLDDDNDPITKEICNIVAQFADVRSMVKELYAEKNKLAETNERLLIENESMRRRIEELEQIEQDFSALVGIMERSRKMAFVPDEKPVFKMVDGALERVNN